MQGWAPLPPPPPAPRAKPRWPWVLAALFSVPILLVAGASAWLVRSQHHRDDTRQATFDRSGGPAALAAMGQVRSETRTGGAILEGDGPTRVLVIEVTGSRAVVVAK